MPTSAGCRQQPEPVRHRAVAHSSGDQTSPLQPLRRCADPDGRRHQSGQPARPGKSMSSRPFITAKAVDPGFGSMHRFALFALLGTSLLHGGWAHAHGKGFTPPKPKPGSGPLKSDAAAFIKTTVAGCPAPMNGNCISSCVSNDGATKPRSTTPCSSPAPLAGADRRSTAAADGRKRIPVQPAAGAEH